MDGGSFILYMSFDGDMISKTDCDNNPDCYGFSGGDAAQGQ